MIIKKTSSKYLSVQTNIQMTKYTRILVHSPRAKYFNDLFQQLLLAWLDQCLSLRRTNTNSFGAQSDAIDIWRTLENFGSELVKIWQNLTKFDRVTSKFSNRSFPHYNLDGSKFCQILSNFFWCLSNFYMSFLIFSRCCQIPVLAFNVRFELQLSVRSVTRMGSNASVLCATMIGSALGRPSFRGRQRRLSE